MSDLGLPASQCWHRTFGPENLLGKGQRESDIGILCAVPRTSFH